MLFSEPLPALAGATGSIQEATLGGELELTESGPVSAGFQLTVAKHELQFAWLARVRSTDLD